MGRRSGIPTNGGELDGMKLAELDAEIARAEQQLFAATISNDRKGFFRKLTWLEAHREKAHGIPAPVRRMRARLDPPRT
jgi:hypothetical protein